MTDREYAIQNNGVYYRDSEFILRIPLDKDLDALAVMEVEQDPSLQSQLVGDAEIRRKYQEILYNNDKIRDFHLAIVSSQDDSFLGNLVIQYYKTDAPEIGITLMEAQQGKGIAAKIIALYMNQRMMVSPVIYFTARINLDNINSQKMIAKLDSENVMQIGNTYCYKIKYIGGDGQ